MVLLSVFVYTELDQVLNTRTRGALTLEKLALGLMDLSFSM